MEQRHSIGIRVPVQQSMRFLKHRIEKTFVGGDAPANERRAAAEANRFRKP